MSSVAFLSNCSIHTYNPSTHRVSGNNEKVQINGSFGLGGMNLEVFQPLSKRMNLFGGINSSYRIVASDSSYRRRSFDAGTAYYFPVKPAGSYFVLAGGAGYGWYQSSAKRILHYNGYGSRSGESYLYSDVLYGNIYMMPYFWWEISPAVHLSFSIKNNFVYYLKYNVRGNFYSSKDSIPEAGPFSYSLKDHRKNVTEPGITFLLIEPKCQLFIQGILPLDWHFFVQKDCYECINDYPTVAFQAGIRVTLGKDKKNE